MSKCRNGATRCPGCARHLAVVGHLFAFCINRHCPLHQRPTAWRDPRPASAYMVSRETLLPLPAAIAETAPVTP